jgi:serine/threonine protein kinase
METTIPDPLIGARLGQYEIERLLGAGGMARVYLARDTLLGREVAIKALAPTFLAEEAAIERFRREAQRVAALDHPHIAPILHMIEHEQRVYLVMPLYVESLRERLRRAPRLQIGEAIRIVSEIGAALEAAHAHGLIHRDVKPGNILLDQHGSAFLCDFGVACKAKATDDADTLTGAGLLVGTPLYMAPEQLCDAELDHRADIYALGVVLYQALTGTTPHTGNSLLAVATSALTDPILPPSALNPAVSPPVERVILRALSRRPADRYASVMRFVEALQAAVDAAADTTTRPMLALPWRGTRSAIHPQPVASQRQSPRSRQAGMALSALALTFALAGGLALATSSDASRAVGPTAQSSQSGSQRAIIPAATASPTARATQTPAPRATTAPQHPTAAATPPLAVTPLRLVKSHGHQCSGSQTITNNGPQTVAWQWAAISPAPHPSLVYGVNAPAQSDGLPANRSPGVAPGGADHLNVQMKCDGQTYTVTLRDSLGRTQRITVISDSSHSSDSSGSSDSEDSEGD